MKILKKYKKSTKDYSAKESAGDPITRDNTTISKNVEFYMDGRQINIVKIFKYLPARELQLQKAQSSWKKN